MFDGFARRSVTQLRLLTDQVPDQGCFPEPSNYCFIVDNLEEKDVARREFEGAGLHLHCVDVIRYLGAYLGPREELEARVQPKVEAWAHGVRKLAKIANWYPQLVYTRLGISLQIEW